MAFKKNITSLNTLPHVAKELLETFTKERIFLFDAQMGNGKTTFIKALCKQLKSEDDFSSPTYSIVNEYQIPNGKIAHFDLYRLKNEAELLDIGFDEYIAHNTYCFIEWPNLALTFLEHEPVVLVKIEMQNNERWLEATSSLKSTI